MSRIQRELYYWDNSLELLRIQQDRDHLRSRHLETRVSELEAKLDSQRRHYETILSNKDATINKLNTTVHDIRNYEIPTVHYNSDFNYNTNIGHLQQNNSNKYFDQSTEVSNYVNPSRDLIKNETKKKHSWTSTEEDYFETVVKNDNNMKEVIDEREILRQQVIELRKALEQTNIREIQESNDEANSVTTEAISSVSTPRASSVSSASSTHAVPPLSIIILVVGTRGDVQPFVALGMGLQARGHKVRIATHVVFRDFVTSNGLDYYPLQGDPAELMKFMVENPGMVTLSPQEIEKNRETMAAIYRSTYDACTSPFNYSPDVIIANPPVHVHTSLAEKLHVPLIISFTMPWEATKAYPNPMATIGAGTMYGNKKSYNVVNEMIWIGLGGEINKFRKKILQLPALTDGANIVSALGVPQIYCFSPALAPRPKDWGNHIHTTGFWFLEEESKFDPNTVTDLKAFIDAGEPPFYIGFGSIVVENPQKLSMCVVEAILKAGVRAIVHQGWAKLGAGLDIGPNVFMLDKAVPHDWLFPLCSSVCHHGGAGTTSTGLRYGRPTIVIPFFGDQPFWGRLVSERGVGPTPIPYKELTPEKLASAILFCQQPEVQEKASLLGMDLNMEMGVEKGCDAFEKSLPIKYGEWTCEAWEYWSWMPPRGWTRKLEGFTDKSGKQQIDLESFPLPKNWKWKSGWQPVVDSTTDAEGWSYMSIGTKPTNSAWKPVHSTTDFDRRRCWRRIRQRCDGQCPITSPLNSVFPVLVYLMVKDGQAPVILKHPFLELSILRGPVKSQSQRTKIDHNTSRPTFNQKFAFRMMMGDILLIEARHWGLFSSPVKAIGKVNMDEVTFPSEVWITMECFSGKYAGKSGKVLIAFDRPMHDYKELCTASRSVSNSSWS